jgi:ComF family protein
LKYERDIALGDTLAHYLVDLLCQQPWQIDLVTPVPVGVARRAQRGYNQSALLALPLAMICNIDYQPRALQRIRETISQVGLTATERRENVRGAFQARSELVSGRRILVVDDVTTSGATMEICAQALMQAGASRVYGLTLARANWQS